MFTRRNSACSHFARILTLTFAAVLMAASFIVLQADAAFAADSPTKINALVDDLILYRDANIQSGDITELTPCDTWKSGSAWYRRKLHTVDGFTVEFSYWAGGGRELYLGGADGIVLQFSGTMGIGSDGEYLGFNSGSVGVELDSYQNDGDPDTRHIGIIEGETSNHLKTVLDDRVDDSTWHDLKVAYKDKTISVMLDGEEVLSADSVELDKWVYVGISASTGSGQNRHMIKNFSIDGDFLESKTFILGKDNNSFWHGASSEQASGFHGIGNHAMDLSYIKALAKDSKADLGSISDMLINAAWPTDGWCFGIAATMGLVHDKRVNVSAITSDTANTYFEMSPPCLNNKLRNAINYYFVAQKYLSSSTGVHTTIPAGMISGDIIRVSDAAMDFHSFLKGIVTAAEYNDLVFGLPGHAVLITDCIKNDDDTYTLLVFDENSVKLNNPYGAFGTIDIDIRSFRMEYTDFEGNVALSSEESENAELYYASTSQIAGATQEGLKTLNSRSLIKIPRSKPLRIVDKDGKIMLQNLDGTIESSMAVYDLRSLLITLAGDDTDNQTDYIILETDRLDDMTILNDSGENIEVELTNSDNIARFSGEFDKVTLDVNEGIKVEGTAYDFHAGLSSKNVNDAGDKSVLVMSGDWTSDLNISKSTEGSPFEIASGGCYDAQLLFYGGDDFKNVEDFDPYAHTYIDKNGIAKAEYNEENGENGENSEGENEYFALASMWKEVYLYTGKVIAPRVFVTQGKEPYDGLEKGVDYELRFDAGDDRKSIGSHAVTVHYLGSYSSQPDETFYYSIVPSNGRIAKVKAGKKKAVIKIKKLGGGVKYRLAYRKKGTKKWKYKTLGKTSATVKKLKSKKRYQFKVQAFREVAGKRFTGKWSSIRTVKIK